jgi:CubicO group peptidase (beta-lactamase class C family)
LHVARQLVLSCHKFGTYFWVDPKEKMAVVWMAQTPGAELRHYQTLLKGLVLQALD